MILQRIFRPAYGRWTQTRPKRWWSLSDRRNARISAAVLDYEIDEELKKYPAEAGEVVPILTILQRIQNRRMAEFLDRKHRVGA